MQTVTLKRMSKHIFYCESVAHPINNCLYDLNISDSGVPSGSIKRETVSENRLLNSNNPFISIIVVSDVYFNVNR